MGQELDTDLYNELDEELLDTQLEELPPKSLGKDATMDEFYSYALAKCPGLAGKIARWLNAELDMDQPALCLGASLALIAALRSKRIYYDKIAAPNLYVCLVAPSAAGKSRIELGVKKILQEAKLQAILMGKPASDSGLLEALKSDSRKLLCWDEFGKAMQEMANSKEGYRSRIMHTMLDLYSAPGSTYVGKEYAEKSRVDIVDPCLSILGCSTPGAFFGAFTPSVIEDGSLGRVLAFFGVSDIEFKEPDPFPLEFLQELIELAHGQRPIGAGNIGDVIGVRRVVCNLSQGESFLSAFKFDCQRYVKKASGDVASSLWGRAYVNAVKLCMILSDSNGILDGPGVLFAIELIERTVSFAINQVELNMVDRDTGGARKRFQALLKPGQSMKKADLTRKAQNLPLSRNQRNDIIADLCEAGIWEESEQTVLNEKAGRESTHTIITCLKRVKW